jgi:hypothetical protein
LLEESFDTPAASIQIADTRGGHSRLYRTAQ